MKQKLLLKTMLLLLALVVGRGAWAADIVVTLDNIGANLGTTANSTAATTSITATGTSDSYTLNYYQCKKQSSGSSYAMLMTKSVNAYISNNRILKHMRQKLIEMQGETYTYIISTSLAIFHRTSG